MEQIRISTEILGPTSIRLTMQTAEAPEAPPQEIAPAEKPTTEVPDYGAPIQTASQSVEIGL